MQEGFLSLTKEIIYLYKQFKQLIFQMKVKVRLVLKLMMMMIVHSRMYSNKEVKKLKSLQKKRKVRTFVFLSFQGLNRT